MSTPLQALDGALRTGTNATEVLARLGEQGFIVVNQEALIRYATEVVRTMRGMEQQAEPVAKTIMHAAIMGATLEGMWNDGTQ